MIPYHPELLFVLYGISEVGLGVFKRSKSRAKDEGTLAMLWAVIGLAVFFSIFIAKAWPQDHVTFSPVVYDVAVLLFLFGIALRWWAIIHLGRFFTVDVAIATDHRIVDDGPYKYVRHPSYTGALLAFIGLGIMLFNWLSVVVLILPILLAFLWRIAIEERALLAAFGADYAAYRGRTKRLLPFIY
ncbi:MAG: isoprenylcysteine carboxylmethyltransferase family protein [Flavobacteriales bacterium]